jgi:hypothetical protein
MILERPAISMMMPMTVKIQNLQEKKMTRQITKMETNLQILLIPVAGMMIVDLNLTTTMTQTNQVTQVAAATMTLPETRALLYF